MEVAYQYLAVPCEHATTYVAWHQNIPALQPTHDHRTLKPWQPVRCEEFAFQNEFVWSRGPRTAFTQDQGLKMLSLHWRSLAAKLQFIVASGGRLTLGSSVTGLS